MTLWIGDRLGPVERACLKSVLRQGHPLVLYCYRAPEHIPDGVTVRDASDIIPEGRVIRHRSGSYSLFSDLFRYELLRRGAGTWVDADLYLLKPLPEAGPYLFARQGDGINQAVLRLPADCPVLEEAIALFDEREVPGWLPIRYRIPAWTRLFLSGRTGIAAMPWGTAGPLALTALLERHGLAGHALPHSTFYPADWREAAWIRRPEMKLEQIVSQDTVGVHLWNQMISSFKNMPAPRGSFLERLQQEGTAA